MNWVGYVLGLGVRPGLERFQATVWQMARATAECSCGAVAIRYALAFHFRLARRGCRGHADPANLVTRPPATPFSCMTAGFNSSIFRFSCGFASLDAHPRVPVVILAYLTVALAVTTLTSIAVKDFPATHNDSRSRTESLSA